MSERTVMSSDARFGWTALLVWACLGVALETAHAFKLASYLDDALTRLLLTLAHAHGVGLALVVLLFAATVPEPPHWVRRALRFAAIAMPLGFAFGAVGHPEGDPSIGIVLAPLGALALIAALAGVVARAWRP